MSSVASHHLSTPLLTHLCPSSVDNRHAPARRVARTYSPMSRAHARAQPDRPGCYGRVHASVPTALVDLVENSAARTTRGCAPTTRRWPGRLASSQKQLGCALGRCQVLGLSCRCLDGGIRAAMYWSPAVRASCVGERQLLRTADWSYRPGAACRAAGGSTAGVRVKQLSNTPACRHWSATADMHRNLGPQKAVSSLNGRIRRIG